MAKRNPITRKNSRKTTQKNHVSTAARTQSKIPKIRTKSKIVFHTPHPLKHLQRTSAKLIKKTRATLKKIRLQQRRSWVSFKKTWAPRLAALFYPFLVFFQTLRSYPWRTAFSLGLTILIIASAYWVNVAIFVGLPSPTLLKEQRAPLTTEILDRNGKELFRVYEDENRSLVSLSQVPDLMVKATIAIEDKDFYNHHGFSVKGISRAVVANFKGEPIQGGSTITQQLVKNTLLTPERTLARKAKELILAILVEGSYSKDEILEMYLNQVAYGGSTYGIEAASHRYFNKPVKDLTLGESALLAGLPVAPSVYTPFGPTPELAFQRQTEVLRRMVEDGYISQEQADAARHEELHFKTDTIDIQAPHFVMYVKQLLAETYGEEMVNQGGLDVVTTLDLDLQNETQKIVTTEVEKLHRLKISNGAALVTNPKTGEILSMIGSINYFDFAHDGQVNVTLRPRQPGSSIKPLTYALALERGMQPSSIIEDTPIAFTTPGSKTYAPKNYDGRFHGKVTVRDALGSSYNVPAVKMLNLVGINTMLDKAEAMGITTWKDRQRFGLALTLGGGEVLMKDMAEMYSTFANYGYTVEPNPILEVRNAQGVVLYRNTCALDHRECPRRKTLDTRVAYQITDILSDNKARTPAFGPNSVLNIPNQQVAVKTGTTNEMKDNWTIGYTTDRLVAVWVGNNDNTKMSYVASGITGASPIWSQIMRQLLDDTVAHRFPPPDGLIKVAICSRTGTLPCRGCPAVREEYFIPGTEPTKACSPGNFEPTPKPSPQAYVDQILTGATTTASR